MAMSISCQNKKPSFNSITFILNEKSVEYVYKGFTIRQRW